MQIKFTVNITQAVDGDGNDISVEDLHYSQIPEAFREQVGNSEHELILSNGTALYFEMEDIEEVNDVAL